MYYNFDNGEAPSHNYYEYGFQNSRGFRALKVWAGLQQIGRAGYMKMIGEDIALARYFFQLATAHPELEAVTHNLSITTLRYVPAQAPPLPDKKETYLNQLNEALLNTLQQEGKLFLSNAIIEGKYCLRACIVNFRTTRKDIEESIGSSWRPAKACFDTGDSGFWTDEASRFRLAMADCMLGLKVAGQCRQISG